MSFHNRTNHGSDVFPMKGGNVSLLRNVLQSQLELKLPSGKRNINGDNSAMPILTKKSMEVEPNSYFGKVLDGPVSPEKYFQGVPPPSYNHINNDSKPPVPPLKNVPVSNMILHRPSNYLKHGNKHSHDICDTRLQVEEVDDGASIISSCISTFGDSSEVAGFSAAAEQRDLYEKYKKKLIDRMFESKQDDNYSTLLPGLFEDISLTPFGQSDISDTVMLKKDRNKMSFSIDLESSEMLVKPKTPLPYSSSTIDHYGTIIRRHKPIKAELTEKNPSRLMFSGNQLSNIQSSDIITSVDLNEKKNVCANDQRLDESLENAFGAMFNINNIKLNGSLTALDDSTYPYLTNVGGAVSKPFGMDIIKNANSERVIDNYQLPISLIRKTNEPTFEHNENHEHVDSNMGSSQENRKSKNCQSKIVLKSDASINPFYSNENNNVKNEDFNESCKQQIGELRNPEPTSFFGSCSVNECPKVPATAIYDFEPSNPRELCLRRGDSLKVTRSINESWLEGEKDGQCGIFPYAYIYFEDGCHNEGKKLRAKFSCTARDSSELSFEKGDVVTQVRLIDENWIEAMNQWAQIGLIPANFFEKVVVPTTDRKENDETPIVSEKLKYDGLEKNDENFLRTEVQSATSPSIVDSKCLYRVIYSFEPTKEDEMLLIRDDLVFVVEKCDDGWFIGTSLQTGDFGIFPGNYVVKQ